MTIMIDESLRALWYVSWDGGDWLAAISTDAEGLVANYRFRYYRERDPWGKKDEKSWWQVGPVPLSEEETLTKTLREMVQFNVVFNHGKSWELIRGHRPFDQFMKELLKLPFVHTRAVREKDTSPEFDPKSGSVIADHAFEGDGIECTQCGAARASHLLSATAAHWRERSGRGR